MTEQYMILRMPRHDTSDPFLGPLAGVAEVAASPRVEVDKIDRRDIPALTSHPEVVAVAPVMPVSLVKPVAVAKVAAAKVPDIAWGIKAVGADTSPFTGDGIIVAVLDTGIDDTHPAFDGVVLEKRNFTDEDDSDLNGHGTHCAGTIFGRTVNDRRIGVAPGVKRALIGKVLGAGGGGSDKIAGAIQWASENGANVISMSLGIDFPGFVKRLVEQFSFTTEAATSRALEGYRSNVQLFERLAALIKSSQEMFMRATVLVAAAGNESRRPQFEIAVSPPARSEGFISVAAIGQAGDEFTVAPFSNTLANIAAPGVEIISARPGGGFATMSGTSMATPHVAGVAALWAEKMKTSFGTLNAAQLVGRVIGTASIDGLQAGFDPFDVGAGLARAPQS